jgi:hypothetical protein
MVVVEALHFGLISRRLGSLAEAPVPANEPLSLLKDAVSNLVCLAKIEPM